MHDLEFDHMHMAPGEEVNEVAWTADKRRVFQGMDVSVKDGGCQIEYEHQDPRIHGIYLEELRKHGVTSGMTKFVDERPYAKTPA